MSTKTKIKIDEEMALVKLIRAVVRNEIEKTIPNLIKDQLIKLLLQNGIGQIQPPVRNTVTPTASHPMKQPQKVIKDKRNDTPSVAKPYVKKEITSLNDIVEIVGYENLQQAYELDKEIKRTEQQYGIDFGMQYETNIPDTNTEIIEENASKSFDFSKINDTLRKSYEYRPAGALKNLAR